jgi:hypothetical protein
MSDDDGPAPLDAAAVQRARVRIVVDALLRTAISIAAMRRHVGSMIRGHAARRNQPQQEGDMR